MTWRLIQYMPSHFTSTLQLRYLTRNLDIQSNHKAYIIDHHHIEQVYTEQT